MLIILDMLLGLPDRESVCPGLHPKRGVVASVATDEVNEWGDMLGSCVGRKSEENTRPFLEGVCRLRESCTSKGLELDAA